MIKSKIKFILFILFLVFNYSKANSQIQENDFYFSINEKENFILKEYNLYAMHGIIKIDDKSTQLNEYTFDLIYKNKVIGRYSDSDFNSFCDLYSTNRKIKKELGLNDLVTLKKMEEKNLVDNVKIALINYPDKFYISPEILNNKGYFLYKYKHFEAALLYFEKVIEKFPKRIVAYLNIADCYWETNEKEKAKENYKKYIQLMKDQKKCLKKIPKYLYDRLKQ